MPTWSLVCLVAISAPLAPSQQGPMARTKCDVSLQDCVAALKPLAAQLQAAEWKTEDVCDLVESFSGFFVHGYFD